MADYDTLTEALNDLKNRGFTTDFNLGVEAIECNSSGKRLTPANFEIVEHYRFEGETDPGDESVLYVIQSTDGSMKGTLVSAYGAYSENTSEILIKKLKINE
jgi:hypothetical protein